MNYCVPGTVRTYLIKVFQQMLIEHPTHSRHYSRFQEYSSENKPKQKITQTKPHLLGAEILLGREDKPNVKIHDIIYS